MQEDTSFHIQPSGDELQQRGSTKSEFTKEGKQGEEEWGGKRKGVERIMMKTMSGEMMREADERGDDDDADDDETKAAVWGKNRQSKERGS